MKFNSIAMAIAITLLAAGCGGGGGGGGGTGTPAPITPVTPVTPPTVGTGTATIAGNRGDYTIARAGTAYTVTNRSSNAASSISGYQAMRFSDMTINLGIGDKAVALGATRLKSLIELYMALLNRVPTADSLGARIDQLNAGLSLQQVADGLYAEAVQSQAISGYSNAMTEPEYVTAIYKVVFGRSGATAPTAAEVKNWSNRLGSGGLSRGGLMVAMLEDARAGTSGIATASVLQLLDNRAAVGDYVAVQQGINYNSAEESEARTSAIAAAVTAADVTTAKGMIGFSDPAFNLAPGR